MLTALWQRQTSLLYPLFPEVPFRALLSKRGCRLAFPAAGSARRCQAALGLPATAAVAFAPLTVYYLLTLTHSLVGFQDGAELHTCSTQSRLHHLPP